MHAGFTVVSSLGTNVSVKWKGKPDFPGLRNKGVSEGGPNCPPHEISKDSVHVKK